MSERAVLPVDNRQLDEPMPATLKRSQQAFERDLEKLLKSHYRQWVAYHGDERVGFGRTETDLYERCLAKGFKRDEFIVRSIEPLPVDEEMVFPADI